MSLQHQKSSYEVSPSKLKSQEKLKYPYMNTWVRVVHANMHRNIKLQHNHMPIYVENHNIVDGMKISFKSPTKKIKTTPMSNHAN